ncbi:MAG: hypothetical protein AAGL17_15640 [Cyanobacteria bacterium J06576_12]
MDRTKADAANGGYGAASAETRTFRQGPQRANSRPSQQGRAKNYNMQSSRLFRSLRVPALQELPNSPELELFVPHKSPQNALPPHTL